MNSLAGMDDRLDEEWITLLLIAKAQGFSHDEIRKILCELQVGKT
ncbi:hypothetical protein [Bacillus sp. FSL K6-3431]